MRVTVYYKRKTAKDTQGLPPIEQHLYDFVDMKMSGYAVLDGEEVPDKYLTDEYTHDTVTYDDASLSKELADLQSKGYGGTLESLAKLKAMHIPIPTNGNVRAVDTLPTTNLHYYLIRDVLNQNGGVVNNDVSSAFKAAAKINPYAAHIPMAPIFEYPQFGWAVNNTQWNTKQYFWMPPIVGKDPLRMGDFRGYQPKAWRIEHYCVEGDNLTSNGSKTVEMVFNVPDPVRQNMPFEKGQDNNVYYLYTMEDPLKDIQTLIRQNKIRGYIKYSRTAWSQKASVLLEGLPKYEDVTEKIDVFWSAWIRRSNIGSNVVDDINDFEFLYIVGAETDYKHTLTFTGNQQRPLPVVDMDIDIRIDNYTISYGIYEQNKDGSITIKIFGINGQNEANLYMKSNNKQICALPSFGDFEYKMPVNLFEFGYNGFYIDY